ncbi:hypothetical protein EDEG_01136 [Edhazardia aedis USNM 41457]|uniref:Uncharacterized protein n=1 Tax=Edhazardia aedis (strain USNM 41457) TaxID=1003232 RepID=J9DTQ2_EDHAE|nr:hypothetical protein EDEG_01136 [Edhazardia aedis USNM 41457]|eukprot:EJW04667.1 hypothetical protein EDEG_01136 [Edhazardia aedis USNM 41457]
MFTKHFCRTDLLIKIFLYVLFTKITVFLYANIKNSKFFLPLYEHLSISNFFIFLKCYDGCIICYYLDPNKVFVDTPFVFDTNLYCKTSNSKFYYIINYIKMNFFS